MKHHRPNHRRCKLRFSNTAAEKAEGKASSAELPPAAADSRQPRHNIRHHTYPEPRVKRASPEGLPASPLFTGTSSHPWLKRPFHAGFRLTLIPRLRPFQCVLRPFFRTGAAAGATHSVASPQAKRRSRDSTRRIRRVKYRRLNPAAGSRRLTVTPVTTPPPHLP